MNQEVREMLEQQAALILAMKQQFERQDVLNQQLPKLLEATAELASQVEILVQRVDRLEACAR